MSLSQEEQDSMKSLSDTLQETTRLTKALYTHIKRDHTAPVKVLRIPRSETPSQILVALKAT